MPNTPGAANFYAAQFGFFPPPALAPAEQLNPPQPAAPNPMAITQIPKASQTTARSA